MTKIELICIVIEIVLSFFTAIMFLSDRVAERKIEYRRVKTVISIVLAIIASFQLAILLEYYYSPEFKILDVVIFTFSFFMMYFVISVVIGNYKIKKDEIKEWITVDDDIEYITRMQKEIKENLEVRENLELRNTCRIVNDCCKIVNFAEYRK